MAEEPTFGQRIKNSWNTNVVDPFKGLFERGAEPVGPSEAEVRIWNLEGKRIQEDLRVRIKVPQNYLVDSTLGSPARQELRDGIIFPYTPSISYDVKADYQQQNTIHNNYTQYFYSNSSIGQINIQAKYTVQNDLDARVYLSTKHLLSALMKMPYGDDPGAGSPPPVCRLFAYGDYMMKNIPIVITGFRVEFPDNVDYYMGGVDRTELVEVSDPNPSSFSPSMAAAQMQSSKGPTPAVFTSQNFVPVLSNFNITCYPVYSRREMLQFSVRNFLDEYAKNTKYL